MTVSDGLRVIDRSSKEAEVLTGKAGAQTAEEQVRSFESMRFGSKEGTSGINHRKT